MQDKLEKPWKFYLSQNKFLKIWENYIRMLHTQKDLKLNLDRALEGQLTRIGYLFEDYNRAD
jgi:hypothetical protein